MIDFTDSPIHRFTDSPSSPPARQQCPRCGQPHIGTVDGPVQAQPLLDGSVEYWRLRQFPCHHCAIIVTWRQTCDADGRLDPLAGRSAMRGWAYLKGTAYAAWCEKHPAHAERLHEEEGVSA